MAEKETENATSCDVSAEVLTELAYVMDAARRAQGQIKNLLDHAAKLEVLLKQSGKKN